MNLAITRDRPPFYPCAFTATARGEHSSKAEEKTYVKCEKSHPQPPHIYTETYYGRVEKYIVGENGGARGKKGYGRDLCDAFGFILFFRRFFFFWRGLLFGEEMICGNRKRLIPPLLYV